VKIDILHDYENGRETPDGRIDPKKNTIRWPLMSLMI
jgi:hypothetical protein